jgi:antitoxin (DNA-binding transcriptional repressor) of toxin-antitoxin stability system
MKNEIIGASEARSQWKELLDRAVAGEVIKIERGGVIFYLATQEGQVAGMHRVVDSALTLGQEIEKHKARKATPPLETFPDGSHGFTIKSTEKNNSVATPLDQAVERKKQNSDVKFCKAGHILASNGKCLQKGCKYA